MAKRKTPKTVDLKPRAEKITDQQLEQLQKAIGTIQQVRDQIGGIETQKHELLHQYGSIQDLLVKLRAEFEKEYGTYDVNVNDGTINHEVDGKVDKKD